MDNIIKLLDQTDEKFQKRGLQELCEKLEKGFPISNEIYIQLLIALSKLKTSPSITVRRWLYKTIGLLREEVFLPYLISQLNGNESDQENLTWIIATLYKLATEKKVHAILKHSSIEKSSTTTLAAGYFNKDFLPKKIVAIKKVLDENNSLSLKWLGLIYGVSHNSLPVDPSKVKDLIIQLSAHDNKEVAEYSVWAIHKSLDGSYSDLLLPLEEITGKEPNVRRWLYRLFTKNEANVVTNLDFIQHIIRSDVDPSAREGLAIGLLPYFNKSYISSTVLEWLQSEKDPVVLYQLQKGVRMNISSYEEVKELIDIVHEKDTKNELTSDVEITKTGTQIVHIDLHNNYINNYYGDQYSVEQAGSVGRNATTRRSNFIQHNFPIEIDMASLSTDLSMLHIYLLSKASSAAHYEVIAQLKRAEELAKKNETMEVLNILSTINKWAWDQSSNIEMKALSKLIKERFPTD